MNPKTCEKDKKRADEAKKLAFELFNSTRGTPSKGKVRRLAVLVMENGLGSNASYYKGITEALEMLLEAGADSMDVQDVADHFGVVVRGLEDEEDDMSPAQLEEHLRSGLMQRFEAYITKEDLKDKVVKTFFSESGTLMVVVNDETVKHKFRGTIMGRKMRPVTEGE